MGGGEGGEEKGGEREREGAEKSAETDFSGLHERSIVVVYIRYIHLAEHLIPTRPAEP